MALRHRTQPYLRGAVPSGVGADRRGQANPEEFSGRCPTGDRRTLPAKKEESNMLKPFIAQAMQRENLTAAQAEEAMKVIMTGGATPAQIGSYLTALRMKGETVEEITGSARAMRANAAAGELRPSPAETLRHRRHRRRRRRAPSTSPPPPRSSSPAPGARWPSTATAPPPRKCGSADVLAALGVNIDMTPEAVRARHRRGRHRVLFRRQIPPGDEARHRRAARDRRSARSSTCSGRSPTRPAPTCR